MRYCHNKNGNFVKKQFILQAFSDFVSCVFYEYAVFVKLLEILNIYFENISIVV